MRALLKLLLLFAIGTIVSTKITGLFVARQRNEGSEVSDEFSRTVILDGVDFTSRAGGLRRGQMCVLLGSGKLDLREATLDPAGAEISVESTLGGLAVIVRDDWAVTVDDELIGGGEVRIEVTSPDDLPEDAPRLRISLVTRAGGSVISTGEPGF